MVQTENNGKYPSQRHTRKPVASPKNVVIVYEQPKVIVRRYYTKTFVPEVNPADYEKRFGRVLLDTSTLLAVIRRLNIQEEMITPPKTR